MKAKSACGSGPDGVCRAGSVGGQSVPRAGPAH